MGVSEVVMSSADVLQYVFVFSSVLIVITGFFTAMSSTLLSSQDAIKGDSIANAMSTVNMHKNMQISINWDRTDFVIGTSEGALLMLYQNGGASVSPYPAVYDFLGAEQDGDFKYIGELETSNFSFEHYGDEKVAIAR